MRFALLLLLVACGKAPSKADPLAEFGNDEKSVLAKLQGVWLVPSGTQGNPQVWDIQGKKAVVHHRDGRKHETPLAIVSPCLLQMKNVDNKDREVAYTFGPGDTPHIINGMLGVRKGNAILLCSAGMILHRADKCQNWTEDYDHPGRWRPLETAPDSCPLTKESDREILSIPHIERKLVLVGDAAMDADEVEHPLVRVKDVAEGLAKLAAPRF